MGVCRARFTRPPDWSAARRAAERAGLWQLPDESSLPDDGLIILDGWGITVELRDGTAYRAYRYGNPDRLPWPEVDSAVRIARAVRGVDSLARTPDEVRLYRGVTHGTYKAAFRPCTGRVEWEFNSSLRHLAKQSDMPVPDSTRPQYVEVVGVLSPAWLAERWGSSFPRVLQVHSLVRAEPWTGRECRGRN